MSPSGGIAYRGTRLFIEDCDLAALADEFGTPLYVYSRAALQERFRAYASACAGHDALICYAVKANSNLAILNQLAREGAGFDIVSGGELLRVLAAGGDPKRIIFSGVGKSAAEMELALSHGIACFNVESLSELRLLDRLAGACGKTAPVSLRVNPDVDAKTHPYVATGLRDTKFGIDIDGALAAFREATMLPNLRVIGIDCHIGSQLLDDGPFMQALERLIELIDELAHEGIVLTHLDLGGGLGVAYQGEATVAIEEYVRRALARVDRWREQFHGGAALRVLFEPGRSIVAAAGVLLSRVQYLKPGSARNYAIVDAAMNDLLRPALYDAWHEVLPLEKVDAPVVNWDLVGPVCESGDWLARARDLALREGDLVAILNAGAYGMAMASNYNTRPRAAEILIDGAHAHLVRKRETPEDLFCGETMPAL